jgi:uncharacterized protein (TIGR02001 family)
MHAELQQALRTTVSNGWGGVALVAALAANPATASADGWTTSFAATSDYIDRGLSQTRGAAALQAGISRAGRGGWYLGAWTSSVANGWPAAGIDGADAELDLIAGYRHAIDVNTTVGLQLVRYEYLGGDEPGDYDYTEAAVTLDYRRLLRLSLSYAPDYSAVSHHGLTAGDAAWSAELAAQWAVARHVAVAAGIGYRRLDALYDGQYTYGSVGITAMFGSVSLSLARHYTDGEARQLFGDDVAGARTSATVVWEFGGSR